MANSSFRTVLLTVDNTTWAAAIPPMPCNAFVVRNVGGVVLKRRTASGDASSEKAIPAGAEESVAFGVQASHQRTRFNEGEAVAYFQTAAGTYDVPVDYVV